MLLLSTQSLELVFQASGNFTIIYTKTYKTFKITGLQKKILTSWPGPFNVCIFNCNSWRLSLVLPMFEEGSKKYNIFSNLLYGRQKLNFNWWIYIRSMEGSTVCCRYLENVELSLKQQPCYFSLNPTESCQQILYYSIGGSSHAVYSVRKLLCMRRKFSLSDWQNFCTLEKSEKWGEKCVWRHVLITRFACHCHILPQAPPPSVS